MHISIHHALTGVLSAHPIHHHVHTYAQAKHTHASNLALMACPAAGLQFIAMFCAKQKCDSLIEQGQCHHRQNQYSHFKKTLLVMFTRCNSNAHGACESLARAERGRGA